jgi:hypothetical protein
MQPAVLAAQTLLYGAIRSRQLKSFHMAGNIAKPLWLK